MTSTFETIGVTMVSSRPRPEASEGDFRMLVDLCGTAIIVQQMERVVYANRAALDCLGFDSNDDLCSRTIESLLEETSYATLASNFVKAAPHDDQFFCGDLKLRRKSNALVDAEVYHIGVRFGGSDATMISFRDVTATKRMEHELRHAQKLEAVGRLAAGIAHEINTPMQFIGDNLHFASSSVGELLTLFERFQAAASAAEHAPLGSAKLAELTAATADADFEYTREALPQALERSLTGVERVTNIVRAMKTLKK